MKFVNLKAFHKNAFFFSEFSLFQSATSSASSNAGPANVQEFSVRLSKAHKKVHHVMSFNATLKVDFAQWKHVRMERENNMRELKFEEEQPKFGAGSEYMREQKEELRRKKLGIIAKKYKQGKNSD